MSDNKKLHGSHIKLQDIANPEPDHLPVSRMTYRNTFKRPCTYPIQEYRC